MVYNSYSQLTIYENILNYLTVISSKHLQVNFSGDCVISIRSIDKCGRCARTYQTIQIVNFKISKQQ